MRHHEELRQKEERAKREEQAKLRRVAASIAKEVRAFWSSVEKVTHFCSCNLYCCMLLFTFCALSSDQVDVLGIYTNSKTQISVPNLQRTAFFV